MNTPTTDQVNAAAARARELLWGPDPDGPEAVAARAEWMRLRALAWDAKEAS